MIILEYLFAIYLCIALLVCSIVFLAVMRAGGWENLTAQANMLGDENSQLTKSKVQKVCAFIVVCWPVLPIIIMRATRRG